MENFAVHLVGVFRVEGWETSEHLVQEDSERPPVDHLRVTLTNQQLWRQVLWGTAEGVCLVLVRHVELAETKVTQGDVPAVVKQDVFWLQVTIRRREEKKRLGFGANEVTEKRERKKKFSPVNDVKLVEVLKSQEEFRRIEL